MLNMPVTQGERIRIRGRVQGVGFRPLLWRLANQLGLRGSVRNDAQGVLLEVAGESNVIDQLILMLKQQLPAIANIDHIQRTVITLADTFDKFQIIASDSGQFDTDITPDIATCPDCLQELFDSNDRRYRYPFINCTHCGPRFSIINTIPYDRANTSMAKFTMCPACQAEYENPTDRRFHAQPNACPVCGPSLWLEASEGQAIETNDVINEAVKLLSEGVIIAIKGIGGFHLACDASNNQTVERMRQRKQRYHKPFALMAKDLAMICDYARVNQQEAGLLVNPAAPIVLLAAQGKRVAEAVAPGHDTLGFALPATPLHHLLMQGREQPIVLTSGNRSDEPQCIDNAEARQKLSQIADYFLMHDRDIVTRLDDSIVRVMAGKARVLRRARGYAPAAMSLPKGFETVPSILAMGAELKSSFCLSQHGKAWLSQHIGDLEHVTALADYRHQLKQAQVLLDHSPELIVTDKHPNYLSTQLGRSIADELGVELIEVQHHHAHIAAVMVEHGLPLDSEPVLGIALDGLGYGDDDALWGGEFLLAEYCQFKRLAHLDAVPLLGGAQAMREPWRNTLAHLLHYVDWSELQQQFGECEIVKFLQTKPIDTLRHMAQQKINSPLASSCGRLFDAVAAAIGVCREQASYEGQAAIELEALAATVFDQIDDAYSFELYKDEGIKHLRWHALWKALLDDLHAGMDGAVIAAKFHQGIIQAVTQTAFCLCEENKINTVVLGGGVFQNCLLLESVTSDLEQADISVLTSHQIPTNDAAIALGQSAVAAARLNSRMAL